MSGARHSESSFLPAELAAEVKGALRGAKQEAYRGLDWGRQKGEGRLDGGPASCAVGQLERLLGTRESVCTWRRVDVTRLRRAWTSWAPPRTEPRGAAGSGSARVRPRSVC